MSSKKIFFSLVSENFRPVLLRIGEEAKQSEFFDEVRLFTEKDFEVEYWDRYKDYYKEKFGFWIWKPYWIYKQLQTLEDGDVLVYLDAGCEINQRGKERFDEYISMVKKSKLGILGFYTGTTERSFCKGDLLDFFSVRDNKQITDTPQIMATMVVIYKNEHSMSFVKKWSDIAHEHFNLVDYSPSVSPDLDGFVQNRCDQSIFSLLCKTTGGVVILPGKEVQAWPTTDKEWRKLKKQPFLATRNKTAESRLHKYNRLQLLAYNFYWDVQNYMEALKTKIRNNL